MPYNSTGLVAVKCSRCNGVIGRFPYMGFRSALCAVCQRRDAEEALLPKPETQQVVQTVLHTVPNETFKIQTQAVVTVEITDKEFEETAKSLLGRLTKRKSVSQQKDKTNGTRKRKS